MSRKQLDKNISTQIEELRKKDKDSLSVAELLTLRAADRTTEVDLDGITLKLRVPMQCEFVEYMDLQKTIQERILSGQDTEEQTAQICQLLSEWCIDDSLTADFFRSGMFSMEDLGLIQREILESETRRIGAVKSFRKE